MRPQLVVESRNVISTLKDSKPNFALNFFEINIPLALTELMILMIIIQPGSTLLISIHI